MRPHYRNYPFRPPRRQHDAQAGALALFGRFLRVYVWPHRRAVALCATLVCLEACSVYVLAWLTQVVVDDVLVVSPPPTAAYSSARAAVATVRVAGRQPAESGPPRLRDAPAGRERPAIGLGRRIDQGWSHTPRPAGAAGILLAIFLAYTGTIAGINLLMRFAARVRIRTGQAITGHLREDIHRKIMLLSLSYHNTHTAGRLLSRVLWDVNAVQDQMLNTLINYISQVVMVLVGVVILFAVDWRLACLALAVMPFYVLVFKKGRPAILESGHEMSQSNSCLYGLVSQKLDAVRAVQAYGRQPHERLAFHRISAVYLRDCLWQARTSAWMNRLGEMLSALGTNGAVFLTGTWLVLDGQLTLGQMLFAQGAAASLFGPVLQISFLNVTLTNLLVSLRRLADILDEPLEIDDRPNAVPFPAPVRHGLSLRHLSFRFPGSGEPVLHDINLDVPAGGWLCVMGASGTGKTTLLHLLARLHEPEAGEILVDGVPLSNIRLESLRHHLALVPQEARIFSGSVRDNICYGSPDASPAQIMAAARAAEFHDFILTLKVQYETLLGEKGISLSGGQKQRLSLARALLTDPELLLLDDCTSALDAETEGKIQETLARIMAGKTAVIVSQRISMARRCHRIAVLQDGTVAEYGTPAELLARGGFYARLHAQQTE
ncbi:MAG: ABC transporter ATP-binding protein [Lentisphaeria bacterium]